MAATRKLQGEIDRCLKKVGEGVEKFEDTWQKFHSASNPNQKEKYEDDLKKEIKKLQRLRDQIKTWITSAEIKDKSSLLERRKLIEMKMEQFKVVERETKTKAYSKEGLTSGVKRDPAEKERKDVSQWLNGCLENLKIQMDLFEADIETLQTAKKKKKNENSDKIEEYNSLLRKHRDHVQKLETLLRMLDNETVEISQIWLIKDDVEYYIENHMELDFTENEMIYADIDGLEEMLLDIGGAEHRDQPPESLLENTLSSSVNSTTSSVLDQSSSSSVVVTPVTSTSSSTPTPTSTSKATSITSKPTTNAISDITPASSPPAAPILQSSSTTSKPQPAPVLPSPSVFSTPVLTPSKPAVPPIPFAAVASAAPNAKAPNSTTNPGIPAQTSNLMNFDVNNATSNGRNTPTPTSVTTAPANFASAFRNGHMSGPSPGPTRIPQDGFLPGASVPKAFAAVAGNTYNSSSDSLPSLKSIAQKATVDAGLPVPSRQPVPPAQPQPPQQQQPTPPQQQQQQADPISASLSHGLYQGSQAKELSHKTEATVPPLLGVAPLGPVSLTKETQMQLTMLEAASRHMPHPSDSERLRPYLPRNPCSTPPYYPQLPPEGSDRIEFFQRLSTETLFFIFYYMEGTKAQYLAASALKKQSWRFHTKYMMWFQRHEEPKVINDEFEQGTYIYFDFEKWGQRKKEGFTFEYRFLEDRELN